MRLNPIIKRDVKVQSRSMRISWGVFVYELILALVFFLAMAIIQEQNAYSTNNIYSALIWLYPVLAVTQLIVLGMVVPIRTASSISGEKERQTFDIMMTTSMTPFAIIVGKVMTAVVQSMLFVAASMPIMALSFIIGGMSWSYLFWFFAIALLTSFFSASIGILCSSICKKTISAVIMSYAFYLIFLVGTVLPLIIYAVMMINSSYYANGTPSYSYEENLFLFLLLNPVIYFLEFFGHVLTGESMVANMADLTVSTQIRGPIRFVASGNNWLIFSTILFLAVSLLFLWIASRCIDPIKRRARASRK